MEAQTIKLVHPLLACEVSFIESWGAWKELWQGPLSMELRHSLLHFGLQIPFRDVVEQRECVAFYLDVADGYCRWDSFMNAGERKREFWNTTLGKEVKNTGDARKVLAQKAFQALCQNFFKDTGDSHNGYQSWVWPVFGDWGLLQKVFWFFRLEGDAQLRNLPVPSENHHVAFAHKFLSDLCEFVWECDNENRCTFADELITRLRQLRPHAIELLWGMRTLDVLLRRGWEKKLDEACFHKLEELAMGFELDIEPSIRTGRRKPSTLEEACLGGSQPARMLVLLRINKAERERLQQIQELEWQRREAEKALEKLRSS